MKSILNNTERDQIAKAIARAESKTSGEIVVSCVQSSGTYRWVTAVLALGGIALGSLALFFPLLGITFFEHTPFTVVFCQCVGMVLALAISFFSSVRRFFVSAQEKQARVHAQAVQYFVHKGIANTRERTGVLIYLSEFEKRVEIIADQGIHKVVGNDFWKDQVSLIVQGIKNRKGCESVCAAVEQIGLKLSDKFPVKKDDKNELPNRPE